MTAAALETGRLILRRYAESDLEALFGILKDEVVNRFLPWFPMKSIAETRAFCEERYSNPQSCAYVICLKDDNVPIGYIKISDSDSHDLGYGLARAFWGKGIVTEAALAVINQARADGLKYITATHDRNNPASGRVMQKAGMKYRYSYKEQWQPKDIPVIFRMYQLNLDTDADFVYMKYWNMYPEHFVEDI